MGRLRDAVLASLALTAAVLAVPGQGRVAAAGATGLPETPLSVQGNRVVDSSGRTVVLRGVVRDGTERARPGVPVTDREIGLLGRDRSDGWRASVVRVQLGSAQWTGACPKLWSNASAYRTGIDREVMAITRRGMIALVDLHTSTAGCTSIDRHAMPDAPIAQQFWMSVATHYRDNPRVAFELYNEPHDVTEDVWRWGTAGPTQRDCPPDSHVCNATHPRYKAAGMQELLSLVTRAAPGHLVVVDGLDYASRPPTQLLDGSAVYGLHTYTCPTPSSCAHAGSAHADLPKLQRWLPLARRAPLLVTEFGFPSHSSSPAGSRDANGAGFFEQSIAFFERQQPAWGWVAFAFDGTGDGAYRLANDPATLAPNQTGLPVYRALRQHS